MNCRHCNSKLSHQLIDLGYAPPSNAYLKRDDLSKPETTYPLRIYVCESCWLVQTQDFNEADELFESDYAYFSSTSSSWLEHAKSYVNDVLEKLKLSENSFVVELASNDGYLLKNFLDLGVPCLGVEPTKSTALVAIEKGIPVINEFFGAKMGRNIASERGKADLVIGNNVFAHVPDINDFANGIANLLKPNGTVTLEFASLLPLIDDTKFDTIYHEHYSYLSLMAVQSIFDYAGLRVYNVEELSTHGGSLRVYGCHANSNIKSDENVGKVLEMERTFGLNDLKTYAKFQQRSEQIKNELLGFLIRQKKLGKKVVGYGAAAKGNTFLNFAGIRSDLLTYICDAAPSKQNKFIPGGHIPIVHPEILKEYRPDYILILPWNLSNEISIQLSYVKEWDAKFVTAIPELKIL